MNFYTNVLQWGNQLFIREVRNGQRINRKVRYEPTLFVPTAQESPYKTLNGENVAPRSFHSIKDAKEFIESRKNQPELVYGNNQYAYNYISDNNSGVVEWDMEKLLIVTLDIEVECENGFPAVRTAIEPMLSITIKNHQNKKIIVWGLNPFKTDRKDVDYRLCKNE